MQSTSKISGLVAWVLTGLFLTGAAAEDKPIQAYDPAPFLQGLSHPMRKNPAARMGLKSLADLPLYQIDMEVDAVLGTIKLRLEFNFKNNTRETLDDLVFRTFPNVSYLSSSKERNLVITKVTTGGQTVTAEEINPTAWRVKPPAPVKPGERVWLSMECNAVIPRMRADAMQGGNMQTVFAELMGNQSREGYGIYARHEGIFNLGFFYPILPVRSNGQWDTMAPAGMGDVAHFDVANYLVKLRVPKTMVVASSGVLIGEQPLGTGPEHKKEVYLVGTALRDFALQLSTRYVVKERKAGGIKVRAFVLAEHEEDAKTILDQTAGALVVFQKMFGPYPYPELDVAVAPLIGGAGGMEYPGLITVAAAVASPGGSGPMGDLMAMMMKSTGTQEFVLAHEVAHQWFHVLVGSDSNRHPYLDEALANYAAVLYFEKRHGTKAATEQLQLELALPYQLHRAFGGQDGVVDRPVREFASQLEYAALVYGKGALFFHFLRRTVGKAVFLRSLRQYVSRQAFRQAEPDDLLNAFLRTAKGSSKVKKLFSRWLTGRHADEDIGKLNLGNLNDVLAQLQQLKGFHNVKLEGVDPAVMKMFEEAVRQLAGFNK